MFRAAFVGLLFYVTGSSEVQVLDVREHPTTLSIGALVHLCTNASELERLRISSCHCFDAACCKRFSLRKQRLSGLAVKVIENLLQPCLLVILRVKPAHGHVENLRDPAHQSIVGGVFAAFILVHSGACRSWIDTGKFTKFFLRQTRAQTRSFQTITDHLSIPRY